MGMEQLIIMSSYSEENVLFIKNLKEAFSYLDKDGSGEITVSEI